MKALFVTGTGTDVGKTHVAAALAQAGGWRYWKPVQTGVSGAAGTADFLASSDTARVRAVAGASAAPHEPAYLFPLAAAPDQAAAAAGLPAPTVHALAASFAAIGRNGGPWLVEGAGGLHVPLNEAAETWLDFLRATRLPALVIASPALGTLNHTTLTVRALQDAGIELCGVVLSGPRHAANEASLARLLPGVRVHAFEDDRAALAAFVAAAPTPEDEVETWLALDRTAVWHPYTQHHTAPEPLAIVGARGAFLETAQGEHLLDAASSWWVNTIGHGRPEIAAAIARQQRRLDHVLFAGATHAPAAYLAQRLLRLAGAPFEGGGRVFFSDNGSTAIEVALKIAYQMHAQRGAPERRLFVSFEGSYHGDTFGAMAVARSKDFHGTFAPLLFDALSAPLSLAAYADLLDAHAGRVAGVVIEPLLQGAGGMRMHSPEFLRGVAALARERDIPLILDEVFTGLGRVGAAFAYQRAGVEPDLVCAAKGLTGGNLPLAVTLARSEAFAAFLGEDKAKALLHGHSYTANPIACAAALAALDIYEREDLAGRARTFEATYHRWIAAEAPALGLFAPRALGGVLAFEWPGSGVGDYFHAAGTMEQVPRAARRRGLFLRTLGNTVYFMPPLATSDAELTEGLAALGATIRDVLNSRAEDRP